MKFVTEYVPCSYCRASGKVSTWAFFKKDCPVCDGHGKREIIMDADFPDAIKAQVRLSAMTGQNNMPPSLFEGVFGFRL
jgi:hypothetical protein